MISARGENSFGIKTLDIRNRKCITDKIILLAVVLLVFSPVARAPGGAIRIFTETEKGLFVRRGLFLSFPPLITVVSSGCISLRHRGTVSLVARISSATSSGRFSSVQPRPLCKAHLEDHQNVCTADQCQFEMDGRKKSSQKKFFDISFSQTTIQTQVHIYSRYSFLCNGIFTYCSAENRRHESK